MRLGLAGLDMSEFFNGIKDFFTMDAVKALQNACKMMYVSIFGQASEATEYAATQITVTPENMFPNVYTIIVNIAETVFFPIAGIILMCILCYECVSMLTESNRMREFGPQDVFILCMKLLCGILLLTRSMDIVNTCFKIGQWAVVKTGIETTNIDLDAGLDAVSYIEGCTDLLQLIGFLALGSLLKLAIFVFSVVVKIVVWMRFVELYMFVVSAPIPFATFLNKEWGQIGQNYVRKILSLAFQPIYMILCFSIFSGIVILPAGAGILGSLAKSFVALGILIKALSKTGTIADSIFNAH